jgi:hypothetical protein
MFFQNAQRALSLSDGADVGFLADVFALIVAPEIGTARVAILEVVALAAGRDFNEA